MDHFSNPYLTVNDKKFLMNGLELTDRVIYSLKGKELVEGTKINEFDLAGNKGNLFGKGNVIIRESDKKMGWSINSAEWYHKEYQRHLKSGFYEYIGKMEKLGEIKLSCREDLKRVLDINEGGINHEFNFFSKNLSDYVLPSLNLMPKVHKLKERACAGNEHDLVARPIIIVTGYGWCTLEASRYLQLTLQVYLDKFKNFLENNGIKSTIINSTKCIYFKFI